MPSRRPSRRRLLTTGALTLAGVAGCLSTPPDTPPGSSSTESTGTSSAQSTGSPATETTSTTSDRSVVVDSLSVADFVVYPLAGTHPHVHRRSGVQYVVVRVDTSLSADTVRERLRLELDDEPITLASRQPVTWTHETVDVAYAVPKGDTVDDGRVLVDGTERRTLPRAVIERLNHPPVFEVGDPSVSPDRIRPGERATATVRFALRNTGEGRGTFGASLKGNLVSGAETVTDTLGPGASREVAASVEVVGEGEEATVRLTWGSGEWSGGIPVVGTPTGTEAETATPSSR